MVATATATAVAKGESCQGCPIPQRTMTRKSSRSRSCSRQYGHGQNIIFNLPVINYSDLKLVRPPWTLGMEPRDPGPLEPRTPGPWEPRTPGQRDPLDHGTPIKWARPETLCTDPEFVACTPTEYTLY